MSEAGRNQPFELSHQLVDAFGRQIEPERFDRDEPIAVGIVRAKDGPYSTGANLMENPEWTENVWRRRSRSVRLQ
jgi:hypothetical protein